MAKKKQPKRKFDEPNRYFTKTGERCAHVTIKVLINTHHLICAVAELLEYDGSESEDKKFKITSSNVRKRLMYCLKDEGEQWAERFHFAEGRDRERFEKAMAIAKERFPKWFENKHGNSLEYILKDD